jgi:hypothetical protein
MLPCQESKGIVMGKSNVYTLWGRAVFNGCVQWAGEAVVGLLPLFAYVLNHGFGTDQLIPALCSPVAHQAFARYADVCADNPDSPLAEICVLAVVISGLSLLSIAQFARGRRQTPKNAITYLMMLLAILSLVAGTLFYARITSHSNEGHEEWTYITLMVALVSSFALAIQESIAELKASDEYQHLTEPHGLKKL